MGSASACQALPPSIIFLGGKGNLQLRLGEDENPVVKGIRSGKPVSTQLATNENIYNRLKEKEQTMLDAIDRGVLEAGSTDERDLELVFKGLFEN